MSFRFPISRNKRLLEPSSTSFNEIQELNLDVKQWSNKQKSLLKEGLRRKNIKRSGNLIRSVKASVRSVDGVVQRVAFQFNRYGVFVEKGAGRGSRLNTVRKSKISELTSKRREAQPWFNPVVDHGLDELADIVQKNYADISVKNILIK